jgi:predicted bacteriocin transport accessory protein
MKLLLQKSISAMLSILLIGCQMNSNSTTIAMNPLLLTTPPTTISMDELTTRIDLEKLIELSNENNPYLLYVGNPSCSSCLQFQPVLLDWISKTKAMVYYLDTLQHLHHLSMFQEEFPSYFPEGFSTPTLYVLNGNQRIERIQANQAFFNTQRFQTLMLDYVSISSELN